MFYLLCFGKDSFSVYDFDEQALAEELAEKWVSNGRFIRVVLCESLAECYCDEE